MRPAAAYTGLGDRETAFEWLDKAYEENSTWIVFLNVDQLFDPIRSDVRYTTLLKKIGFDE